MEENLSCGIKPDNEILVVQSLKNFACVLGELEVSFRGVEESKRLTIDRRPGLV